MFDIGFGEMVLLAAIALIAIGPKQLPEVARALGKLLGEVKKTVGEVTSTVANAREETDRAIRKVTSDLTDISTDINDSVEKTINSVNIRPDARPQQKTTVTQVATTDTTASATAHTASAPSPIIPLGEHPGDPPWVVNPDLPRPDETTSADVSGDVHKTATKKSDGEST